MIHFILFSSILLIVSAQFPMMPTTDQFLRMLGLELDKGCTNSKIPDYENIVNDLKNYDNIKLAINPQFIKADDIRSKFCGNEKLNKYSDVLKDKLNFCLNEAQKDILSYVSKSDDAIHEYICNDGINYIKALSNFDTTNCPKNNNSQECLAKFDFTKVAKPEDYFNKENCMKRIKAANCMLVMLKSCEEKSAYKLMKKLSDAEFNATPCKEYNSATSIFNPNTFTLLVSFMILQLRNYFF